MKPTIATLMLRLCALATATLLLTGCGLAPKGPWYDPWYIVTKPHPSDTGPVRVVAAAPAEFSAARQDHLLANSPVTQMTMSRWTVPIGSFSANDRAWRDLDEDVLDSDTSLLLAHNGLRAGTAPQARWSQINALLNVPGATHVDGGLVSDGRSSINLVTRANVEEQLIYYVDADLQSHGKTFDHCDNALRVVLGTSPRGDAVAISLEPVVQLGTVNVIRTGYANQGVLATSGREEETFPNLRLTANVKPGNFLIISPSDPRKSKFSVGTRFLSDDDAAPPVETIFVFSPLVK